MSDRIIEVDYNEEEGLTLKVHPKRFPVLPEETREHLHTAHREALLALKSLIDSCVAVSPGGKEKTKPRSRIKVE